MRKVQNKQREPDFQVLQDQKIVRTMIHAFHDEVGAAKSQIQKQRIITKQALRIKKFKGFIAQQPPNQQSLYIPSYNRFTDDLQGIAKKYLQEEV